MANTLTKIASYTTSGSTNLITFSSIPQTYSHLLVLSSAKYIAAGVNNEATMIRFNSSSSNYSYTYMLGQNSLVSSGRASSTDRTFIGENHTTSVNMLANTFSNGSWLIPNYASSSIYKSAISDAIMMNNATAYMINVMISQLWSSTAAITQIDLYGYNSSTMAANSTFTLYGIKNTA